MAGLRFVRRARAALTLLSGLGAALGSLSFAPLALADEVAAQASVDVARVDVSVRIGEPDDAPAPEAAPRANAARADEPVEEERETGWSDDHPFALGMRGSVWASAEGLAPGVGGHVRLRPLWWLGLEAFTDHYVQLGLENGSRRDHTVGMSGYVPIIGDDRFFLAPLIGGSLDLRVTSPDAPAASSAYDLLFGAHAGVMGEVYVLEGFAAYADARVHALVGYDIEIKPQALEISGEIGVTPVGQISLGASYFF